jgi:hypothetical protein
MSFIDNLYLKKEVQRLQEENAALRKMIDQSELVEKNMTKAEEEEASRLHKKVPMKSFTDQYGKEKGEKIFYATTAKMAMKKK